MTEQQLNALFLLAGFEVDRTYKIQNEYWGNDPEMQQRSPWWLVKTKFGLIKIGWRKRVINIDWSDTSFRSGESTYASGELLGPVTNDKVTKNKTIVHAWTYGNAVNYLSSLNTRLQQVEYADAHPEENK